MSRIHFDPIVGRGSECEEGIIWQMEFLYTETTSMDKILLVLVVYNDVERLCRLILYAIDASDTQNVTIEKISRLPLEKNTSLPLLLIPLKFQPEAFILITEQQACLLTADDLGCGNVLYPTSMIPKIFRSIECPLFTAYATHLDPTEEYIYLGSAEGHLYKLEVKVTSELNWIPIKKVNPVGQSMCLLGTMDLIEENTARKMDVLLYSGESADSQVLLIPSKHPPASQNTPIDYTVLQVLVNRAPLTDFQIAENFQDHQDALIACSGQGEHGSLSVITHGIQAEFLHASDPEWKGISALWDLSLSSLEYEELSCLIATSAKDTRLFCIEDRQIKDITSTSGIKSDIETIHVDTIVIQQYKLLLQIYSRGLLIIDVGKHDNSVITKWEPDIGTDYHIELATSWQINDKVYIALCIMYKDMFTLYILNIKSNESSPLSLIVEELTTKPLDVCPSYIGQFKFR
ncbi:mono-functional DNA-alkylating methyl methanesulfonate N-term-domain-containing protein [Cokeromyces recurvatus]|uniref:mono-functional DNA-alkylating methyl methanesulfonate N-term-domain-containing protein n=1 Tax=Cokeromyces recurvatus TaxID=90255 RepID=UPI00221E6D3D|nr:mono-functional DNA-alkylating methyl methanesulfonate N-term-domain-containing protein [Cokeromyces recurvatus]KAI7907513.1 mono-functional DNA-alkylating methyl methanesulfonate N-term-domain-containing protein [Cokeromyces recurvatus]